MTETAVTGMGVLAPNGAGIEAYWSAVLRGHSGLAGLARFDPSSYPARLAGEIDSIDAGALLPNRLRAQTDQLTRLSLVAAEWALADASLDPATAGEYAIGVVTANTAGGFEFGQHELENLWSKGSGHVSAYQSFAWFYAVNTGQISIRHGLRGPGAVLVADGAGGLDYTRREPTAAEEGDQCRHRRGRRRLPVPLELDGPPHGGPHDPPHGPHCRVPPSMPGRTVTSSAREAHCWSWRTGALRTSEEPASTVSSPGTARPSIRHRAPAGRAGCVVPCCMRSMRRAGSRPRWTWSSPTRPGPPTWTRRRRPRSPMSSEGAGCR